MAWHLHALQVTAWQVYLCSANCLEWLMQLDTANQKPAPHDKGRHKALHRFVFFAVDFGPSALYQNLHI